jgi:hypothetical protein
MSIIIVIYQTNVILAVVDGEVSSVHNTCETKKYIGILSERERERKAKKIIT